MFKLVWESVVIQFSEKPKGNYCTLFFDNFINSTAFIDKIFEDEVYGIGTVWSN